MYVVYAFEIVIITIRNGLSIVSDFLHNIPSSAKMKSLLISCIIKYIHKYFMNTYLILINI